MAEVKLNKNRFTFVGVPVFGKENVKTTEKASKKEGSPWMRTRLHLSVKANQNLQFLALEYIHNVNDTKIKLFDKDGESFEVKPEDTLKPEIMDRMADYSKITVNLETDEEVKKKYMEIYFRRMNHLVKKDKTEDDNEKIAKYNEEIKEYSQNVHQFIHVKDVIDFIEKNRDLIAKYKIRATGDARSNFYKGKNNLQYIPNNIELELREDAEPFLGLNMDIFFDKDGVEDIPKEKKMIISGYVKEKIKKEVKMIPTVIEFSYGKIDMEDEKQVSIVNFIKAQFEAKKKKLVYKLAINCQVINGSEEKEFTIDALTDIQRMSVALGKNKLEDFKPRGNVYGEKKQVIRLIYPDFKANPQGAEEDIEVSEIPSFLVIDTSSISVNETKDSDKKEDKDNSGGTMSNEDYMKSLFGK